MADYPVDMEWNSDAQLQQRLDDAKMLVRQKDGEINKMKTIIEAKDSEAAELKHQLSSMRSDLSAGLQDCEQALQETAGLANKLQRLQQEQPCTECHRKSKEIWQLKEKWETEEQRECQRSACRTAKQQLRESEKKLKEFMVWDVIHHKPPAEDKFEEKAHETQERMAQLAKEKRKLEREKEVDVNKLEKIIERKDAEIEELKKQPCSKQDCRHQREKVDKLTKEKEECERQHQATIQACEEEVASLKSELDRERSAECRRRGCNSAKQQLKQLEKIQSSPCERQDCTSAKQQLEMELRQLKSESGPCMRTDCREAHGAQQQVAQLVKEKQSLEREKEAERNKLEKKIERKNAEIEELKKQPCSKPDCHLKREKVDKLTKEKEEWEQKKNQHKEEYRNMKNKLDELERKPCTNPRCQNAYGKEILSVLGRRSLSDGSQELTVNQSLEHLDGKLDVVLDRLAGTSAPRLLEGKCQNEECLKTKRNLERKVKELESLLYAEKCQRPDCVKLRRDLKQEELAETGKSGNIGKRLQKMTGAEHSELIDAFEAVTTSPDGILGELEDAVDPFTAKRVLSWIFQLAYDSCTQMALKRIYEKMKTLFSVNNETNREDMEDISQGYGLLLHGAGLKTEQVMDECVSAVAETICSEFSHIEKIPDAVKATLQPGNPLLNQVVRLTWKFITLPSPLVICQPATFNEQIHEPEFGYWDKSVQQPQLIYTRPVVYRSYQGILACKAWVANTVTPTETPAEEQQSKSWLSKLFGL